MNPRNFDRSLNDTNPKLLAISISCYSARKKSSKDADKAVFKKSAEIVVGKEAIKKTVGSTVD